jgi:TIR domain
VFISHAAADEKIADQVVDLLNTAMQINVTEDVFCSSVYGCNIPPGVDFKQFIKDQIQTPRIVLLLVSQQYLASAFCLAEAGASWAMSHRAIPFVVPPVKFPDLKAVLEGTQAGRINDPKFWNDVVEIFEEELGIKTRKNRWELKRDEAINKIDHAIKHQKPPLIVSLARFQEVEGRLAEANEDLENAEQEIERLKGLNAALKKAKNADAVAEIELKSLPAFERFEKLVGKVQKGLAPLPSVCARALYDHCRGQNLEWPNAFGHENEIEDIKNAIDQSFLVDEEEQGVSVNEEDPKISRALEALTALERFLDKADNEFVGAYLDRYDHQPKFTSRQFWDEHIK